MKIKRLFARPSLYIATLQMFLFIPAMSVVASDAMPTSTPRAECQTTPQRLTFVGANQKNIEGWLWRSGCAAESAPAVVMLHGCSGIYGSNGYGGAANISSRFTRWAGELNNVGMHALLVDSFSTRDPDDPPQSARQDYCSDRDAVEAIKATEEADRPRDAIGGYMALLNQKHNGKSIVNANKIGLLGWSHGGSSALATVARNYIRPQPFKTAQIFYPGCGLYGTFGDVYDGESTYVASVPTNLYIGTKDTISSIPACTTHAQHSMASGGAPMQIYSWQNAMHSFDGANCQLNAQGPLVSPWTMKAYKCSGTYNGTPFNLHDWMARVNADALAMCAFRTILKGGVQPGCPPQTQYP